MCPKNVSQINDPSSATRPITQQSTPLQKNESQIKKLVHAYLEQDHKTVHNNDEFDEISRQIIDLFGTHPAKMLQNDCKLSLELWGWKVTLYVNHPNRPASIPSTVYDADNAKDMTPEEASQFRKAFEETPRSDIIYTNKNKLSSPVLKKALKEVLYDGPEAKQIKALIKNLDTEPFYYMTVEDEELLQKCISKIREIRSAQIKSIFDIERNEKQKREKIPETNESQKDDTERVENHQGDDDTDSVANNQNNITVNGGELGTETNIEMNGDAIVVSVDAQEIDTANVEDTDSVAKNQDNIPIGKESATENNVEMNGVAIVVSVDAQNNTKNSNDGEDVDAGSNEASVSVKEEPSNVLNKGLDPNIRIWTKKFI